MMLFEIEMKHIGAADEIKSYTWKKKSTVRKKKKKGMTLLEVKMEQDNCRRSTYKLNLNNILANIFRGFEVRTKVRLIFWTGYESIKCKCLYFLMFKVFQKGNNCVFWLCQQTIKVLRICLPFKILKRSSKKRQQSS